MADKKGAGDSMPEVDVLLKGLLAQGGVQGFMVFNDAGIPIKWTNSGFIKPGTPNSANPIPPGIIHATALMSDLTDKAKAVTKKLLGDDGELVVMRLHTQSSEYVVAPSHESTLVVVQNAHSAEQKPLVVIAEAEQMAKLESEKKGGGGDKK